MHHILMIRMRNAVCSFFIWYNIFRLLFMSMEDENEKILVILGGGDTNGRPQIDKTSHLKEAYEFGKTIYEKE